jgi:16S rRNA (cytidine1402-2'-O)-methyltransferase
MSEQQIPAHRPSLGRLFLIPTPLGAHSAPRSVLPADTLAAIAPLDCFVAESAKSARAFLKAVGTDKPLQALEIRELNEHTPAAAVTELLAPLRAGRDVGLLSEAGCPAVADPGANLVAAAHVAGIRVIALIGPSSLLLALMASGLNGQRFGFVGYLPSEAEARGERLRELEQRSRANDETLLWIETPYRNQHVYETALAVLSPATRLFVGTQLSLVDESTAMRTIHDWRTAPVQLAREPTVFGLLAARPTGTPGRERPPPNPARTAKGRRQRTARGAPKRAARQA